MCTVGALLFIINLISEFISFLFKYLDLHLNLMKYDAIVVGAGSAGCRAAYAIAKNDFDVCLIDAKPRDRIGDKICGNAIGDHHLKRIGLTLPSGIITNSVEGLTIYSPNLHELQIPGGEYSGKMIDRLMCGQYFLNQAIDAGTILKDRAVVTGPIIEDDSVKGVEVYSKEKIYAEIIIDASGLRSPIRPRLKESWAIETQIDDKDINLAYREIRRVKRLGDGNYCNLYFNQNLYPGGYAWIFPQSEDMVNVGLGVQKVKGCPNPRERLYETLLKDELFKGSEVVNMHGIKQAGGMEVSTRRSLSSLVWDGLVIAGEAGMVMDPVIGSGHGQAIVTGEFAGRVVADALKRNEASKKGLWHYNLMHYAEDGYGPKYTAIDAFRIYLQSSRPEHVDFAVEHRLFEAEDLLNLTTKGKLSFSDKLKKVIRGIENPSLLMELYDIRNVMDSIYDHCLSYPNSFEGLFGWKSKIDQIFSKLEEQFEPYAKYYKD